MQVLGLRQVYGIAVGIGVDFGHRLKSLVVENRGVKDIEALQSEAIVGVLRIATMNEEVRQRHLYAQTKCTLAADDTSRIEVHIGIETGRVSHHKTQTVSIIP